MGLSRAFSSILAIELVHAVGLPFLEKLIRSPVDGDYASSYCAVGLAFVKKLLFEPAYYV